MSTFCRECGAPCQRSFCSKPCRMTWHNRRKSRGAEFYDFVMALRYERDEATKAEAWTTLCSLARACRDSDKALRAGRHSWNLREATERVPLAFSTDGDRR